MTTEKLLQSKDIAERLSVSENTLKKWRHEKKGPPFHRICGRMIRYRESEVWTWLRDHCNQQHPA